MKKNKAINRKLWIKYLKKEKFRNICVISAVILTTILYMVIFSVSFQFRDSQQEKLLESIGWKAHASILGISNEQYEKLKQNSIVKEISYLVYFGDIIDPDLEQTIQIQYNEGKIAEWNYCHPTIGNMPLEDNEIVLPEFYLEQKNISKEIGQKLEITYIINGDEYTKEFILSGYYNKGHSRQGVMLISKKFADELLARLEKETELFNPIIGKKGVELEFYNSKNIVEKLNQLIKECNLETELDLKYQINKAYTQKEEIQANTILFIIIGIFFIGFTGYLIIYNIFSISIVKEIQFYGLLKIIGFGKRQIHKFIRSQIVLLSLIGIPIGLVIGYMISKFVFPILLDSYHISLNNVEINNIVFIFSTIATFLVIVISCYKPEKLASKISPIHARKYIDITTIKSKKKSKTGFKLYHMAYKNLWRDGKRTRITILSITLSLLLLNLVYSFVYGLNADIFIKNQMNTDFLISTKEYFKTSFELENHPLDNEFITELQTIEGIEEYGGSQIKQEIEHIVKENILKDKEKQIFIDVYGLDAFPASFLKLEKGEWDYGKFSSGDYVVVNTLYQGDERIVLYNVGDKIEIDFGDHRKEYEVLAVGDLPYNLSSRSYAINGMRVYLPSEEWTKQFRNSNYFLYICNIKEDYENELEEILKEYKITDEKMAYESKETFKKEYDSFINGNLTIGIGLSVILGIIGIINFVNIISTNFWKRKREFAILESIGMTKRELYQMVVTEGIYFIVIAYLINIIIGTFITYGILRFAEKIFWFLKYRFTCIPLLIAAPFLIAIAIIIPMLCLYFVMKKESLLSRLSK